MSRLKAAKQNTSWFSYWQSVKDVRDGTGCDILKHKGKTNVKKPAAERWDLLC